jgi:predicted dinucleotide-binding enzyme
MKLAIISAGSVGGTPGTARAQKAAHEIFFGVRSPNSAKAQAAAHARRQGAGRCGGGGEAHATSWIELALKRGLGRNLAFAEVRR